MIDRLQISLVEEIKKISELEKGRNYAVSVLSDFVPKYRVRLKGRTKRFESFGDFKCEHINEFERNR